MILLRILIFVNFVSVQIYIRETTFHVWYGNRELELIDFVGREKNYAE